MSKFELKIDLNVLHHLGINLYSNVPAVLSELIANAWDADSTKVCIETSQEKIVIEDNGCGMNVEDINSKFLKVGYQRRKTDNDDKTPRMKREVMGRKGIGKLSIFSIAGDIKIYTKKENETIGIALLVDEIEEAIRNNNSYYPKGINITDDKEINAGTGTKIVLSKLKKRILSSIETNLKKRISRRFDIWSSDFKVVVNKEVVNIEDKDYFHKLEFSAIYGDYPTDNFPSFNQKERLQHRENNSVDEDNNYKVRGWIGLVKESGMLEEDGDNLNKISVLVRKKMALDNILEQYREGGLYTKFLIGEIQADFLDLTSEDDITTSSRQDFIQNDERFILFKDFIQKELRYIQGVRRNYKQEEGANAAREIPAIKEWFNQLKGDTKNAAKKLFGRINSIATDSQHKKILYKHAVLAFEHLNYKDKLNKLDSLEINNLEAVVNLFSELDDIEATLYHQITQGRLESIKKLNQCIDGNTIESIIQVHICEHLWLLDPSWDRATETPTLESSVVKAFEKISAKLTDAEKKARIDIRYKKISGKHIIIELKRNSVSPSVGVLTDQVIKYIDALRKQLQANNENGQIEAICLVGKGLKGWQNDAEKKKKDEASLKEQGIRVVTYEELIKDAEKSYKAYLDKYKDLGRIQDVLQGIEDEVQENH